jgi:Ino eighty subunit 2
MDTINRLLNKQEPKRKRRVQNDEDGDELVEKAPAAFVRYIQTTEGSTLLVPDQWVEAPIGEIFSHSIRPLKKAPAFSRRLVEEIS